jgi:four helix bundle protein
MELVKSVYELTNNFPKEEIYGLTSQMKRASVSIPSNIAEGKRRGTRKDYRQFLVVAYGSGSELETQIEIAKMLALGKNANYDTMDKLLEEVMKMLNKLISSLQPTA